MSIFNKGILGKFIRFEVKGAIRKLAGLLDKLPEPTPENLKFKNSLTIREWMNHLVARDLEQEDDKLFRGIFKFLIIVYDFDIFWRERFDRFVKLVKGSDWILEEDKEEPRYQWWLEEKDAPKNRTLIELLRMERHYAMQDRDGIRSLRLKVMQNIAEGLSEGKEVHEEMLRAEGMGGSAKWDKGWEVNRVNDNPD